MGIFDSQNFSVLTKTMEGLWRRQEVISDNLANMEAPNFKRQTVSFEKELQAVLEQTGSKSSIRRQIQNVNVQVNQIDGETMRTDGNNVDLEKESTEQARTTLEYSYAQRVLNDSFSRLRMAISEGRK